MAERPLETWAVGTAVTVFLVVAALLGSHLGGTLASVLPAIGTPAAAFLFGYLWLLTVVAAGTAVPSAFETPGFRVWLARTATSGAVLALLYLTIVLVIGFVSPLPDPVEPGLRSVFAAVAIGTAIGAAIGPVLGVGIVACRRLAIPTDTDAES